MVPDLLSRATTSQSGTPIGAAGRGIAGGLAGALLLSLVSRMLPVLRTQRIPVPTGRSADAFQPTLAQALTVSQSPGPEGLAEQFAFKVASGVFGRDLSSSARLAGRVIHVVYGSLLQASYPRPPAAFGAIYGFLVWLIGPAFLVPAMRLMGRPSEEPVGRTAALITGHLAYGVALATAFEALQRKKR
ncbi:MAG: hypothetical protein K0S14_3451 [Thermomicrobiales bacterium]|nr:hypothetical protein [Thermomicrobiales bacterium]